MTTFVTSTTLACATLLAATLGVGNAEAAVVPNGVQMNGLGLQQRGTSGEATRPSMLGVEAIRLRDGRRLVLRQR